ncbi:MAG: hypothetical protein Q7U34_03545 [Anaerolineales bacterium]|nr:hypothetical protein [Anaerolineales bacterium]MDO9348791.1 hypothetical protein [Anaerolineales bacterium]
MKPAPTANPCEGNCPWGELTIRPTSTGGDFAVWPAASHLAE